MIDGLLFALALVSALGCGLMAGAFFAFSAFVMNALARLPPAQGIAAMRSINVAAITPAFTGALFGTAPVERISVRSRDLADCCDCFAGAHCPGR
jgi:uncharacterized membrane protein